MLRLNQPFVALSTAEALLQTEQDPAILEGIRASQMEAAWRLHEWTLLDKLVDESNSAKSPLTQWGATNASILYSLKRKDETTLNTRMDSARCRLVDSLTAMTIEDSDTYAQAYKYITQLHILAEIEEAKENLLSLSSYTNPGSARAIELTPERLNKVLCKWQVSAVGRKFSFGEDVYEYGYDVACVEEVLVVLMLIGINLAIAVIVDDYVDVIDKDNSVLMIDIDIHIVADIESNY
ncbi:unnamed protein product, partial [Anisakis simplex]|uniref:FAT domain-containing protein n=1 Tax=Anisakis simplex TaxID=6269 RepID=A0A0M3JH51_ANISI